MVRRNACAEAPDFDALFDDDMTEVTRMLRWLDACVEESAGNLREVGEKAERLTSSLERSADPERMKRHIRETLTPPPTMFIQDPPDD
jgi:hypothetical protein